MGRRPRSFLAGPRTSNEEKELVNPRYADTFRRHKVLFLLPVVITTILAIWFVVGTPKQYRAGASLWVDTPPTQASSLQETNPAIVTPAAQAQQLLAELLATKQFRLEIAHRGPLSKYLARHPSQGFGPTALLKKLRGKQSVDDRAFAALDAKHVLTAAAGPQVLGIEYHGPSSAVAVGTVKALIRTLNERRNALEVNRQQLAVQHYRAQMQASTKTLAELQARIAGASSTGLTPSDVGALQQGQRIAQTRLTRATRGYSQASLNLEAARTQGATYHVIDAPKLPAPAVTGIKKSGMVVVAGMFVGALISFLGLLFFTRDGRPEEAELRNLVPATEHDVEGEAASANGSSSEQESLRPAERAG